MKTIEINTQPGVEIIKFFWVTVVLLFKDSSSKKNLAEKKKGHYICGLDI